MGKPSRVRLRWGWLLLSLTLTAAVALPGAIIAVPHVRRVQMLSRLTHPDLEERQRGFNYLARHIDRDRRVLAGAIRALDVPDQANFVQLVQALDRLGRWRRPTIPLDPWLRWIGLLGADADAESRVLAAQAVADLGADAADPRLPALLQPWLADRDEKVRFNTLVAAAELAGAAADPRPYEALLAQATTDAQPQIAREAWLLLGLLDPHSGVRGNWRQAPVPVAAAMLWSAVRSDPDHPQPALEALADEQASVGLRSAAVYALGQSRAQPARQALDDLLTADPATMDEAGQLLTWRAMTALAQQRLSPPPPAVTRWLQPSVVRSASPLAAPVVFAAAHSYPGVLAERFDLADLVAAPTTLLAALEGWSAQDPPLTLALPVESHDLLHLAAAAATREPDLPALRRLLEHASPALRDVACVIAVDRLPPESLDTLVQQLITAFDDRGKMSGAVLSGLSGLHGDLLAKRAAREDVWAVRSLQHVGLWMQNRQPSTEPFTDQTLAGLLTRDDLPTTSLLLAMLHRDRAAALDYLLTPRADERQFAAQVIDPRPREDATAGQPLPLLTLLDDYRWHRVLHRYLPPEAPRLQPWADPDVRQFQLDLLRNWYLLHRHKLVAAAVVTARR